MVHTILPLGAVSEMVASVNLLSFYITQNWILILVYWLSMHMSLLSFGFIEMTSAWL